MRLLAWPGHDEMTQKLWGEASDVWQWGTFTPSEADALRDECQRLGIVPELSKASDWSLHSASYTSARSALENVALVIERTKLPIDPSLRFVAFFGKADDPQVRCNASARRAPDSIPATYIIKCNIEGVIDLGNLIVHLISLQEPDLQQRMPGTNLIIPGHDGVLFHCLKFALFFLLFHEFGHVLHGHLDWQPPLAGRCELLTEEGRMTRRTLEEDADQVAGTCLPFLLEIFKETPALFPGDVEADDSMWGLSATLGCFAFFALVSEGGFSIGPCYHSPFTRMVQVGRRLKISDVEGASQRLLTALIGAERDLGVKLVPPQHSRDAQALHRDIKDLDSITLRQLKELRSSGKLNGWLTRPDSNE